MSHFRFTLLIVVVLLLLTACASEEEQIKQQITQANYCETANDCVDAGGKCPFDCYIFVNKSEVGRIRSLVEGFDSQCTYSCIAISGVDCVQNKCVPTYGDPPMEPRADMTDGNVGAACTAHTDCHTPMGYLTRSSCPFTSQCINGSCAVTCPMMEHDVTPAISKSYPVSCKADADCDCSGYVGNDKGRCSCIDGACMAVVRQ